MMAGGRYAMSTSSYPSVSDPRRLIDRNARAWIIYVGGWFAAVLISASVNAALVEADTGSWIRYTLLYGGYWSFWGLATPVIYRLIAHDNESGLLSRSLRLAAHLGLLAGLILASNLYFMFYNSMVVGAVPFSAETYWSRFTGSGALPFAGIHVIKYSAICLICIAVWQQRQRRYEEQARIAAELESGSLAVQLSDAKLATLREQLHPHLLFNALNCIASLIEIRRNADAYAAVSDLATLLRRTLELGKQQTVALREDVELARSYLRIAELRFAEHLSWQIEVDADCEALAVPPLLLQPLVENAVMHAANCSEKPVHVSVEVRNCGAHTEIVVSDDGPGMHVEPAGASAGTGIGLGNLRQRLGLLYGASAELLVEPRSAGRGTVVRISLPSLADSATMAAAHDG
jgi:sensor histidine kinase YesM